MTVTTNELQNSLQSLEQVTISITFLEKIATMSIKVILKLVHLNEKK